MTRRDTFEGCSLVDVLDRLEKGRIGHQAAMHWLHIESLNDLVDIVYANGRVMSGHQDMIVVPKTHALLRRIARPIGEQRKS